MKKKANKLKMTNKEAAALIERAMKGGKQLQVAECSVAIGSLARRLLEAEEKIAKLTEVNEKLMASNDTKEKILQNIMDDVKTLKEENKKLRGEAVKEKETSQERLFLLEKKNIAANLIIKNMEQTEDEETKETVEAKVKDLLQTLEVEDEVQVDMAMRFRKGANAPEGRPSSILVKLRDPKMKGAIFRNVKKLRDSPLKGITIANEYPAAVRPLVKLLEQKAYKIRQESDKTTRTRIEMIRGKPVLKIKPEGQEQFTPVPN